MSWLGTICYLTREAIEEALTSLTRVCAPGSRIVFDYFQPKSTMSPSDLELFETLDEGRSRLIQVAELPKLMGFIGRWVLELLRRRLHTLYLRRYFAYSAHPRNELDAWMPIVAAVEIGQGFTEGEEAILRSIVEKWLGSQEDQPGNHCTGRSHHDDRGYSCGLRLV